MRKTGLVPVTTHDAMERRGYMPENITETNDADEQGQAQEPTQNDGADETTESDVAGEQPTPDEVDAALKAVEDEAEEESTDDEGDDEDAVAESEETKDLLKKIRKKNRESKGLRERATTAEHQVAQYKAAEQTGLPLSMASRLQGSTAEELQKDAETLLSLVGKKNLVPGALPDTGDRQGDFQVTPETETDLGKIGARIYER